MFFRTEKRSNTRAFPFCPILVRSSGLAAKRNISCANSIESNGGTVNTPPVLASSSFTAGIANAMDGIPITMASNRLFGIPSLWLVKAKMSAAHRYSQTLVGSQVGRILTFSLT